MRMGISVSPNPSNHAACCIVTREGLNNRPKNSFVSAFIGSSKGKSSSTSASTPALVLGPSDFVALSCTQLVFHLHENQPNEMRTPRCSMIAQNDVPHFDARRGRWRWNPQPSIQNAGLHFQSQFNRSRNMSCAIITQLVAGLFHAWFRSRSHFPPVCPSQIILRCITYTK